MKGKKYRFQKRQALASEKSVCRQGRRSLKANKRVITAAARHRLRHIFRARLPESNYSRAAGAPGVVYTRAHESAYDTRARQAGGQRYINALIVACSCEGN